MQKPRARAFTLVEVLLTVALIIILAGALLLPVALEALGKAQDTISGADGKGLSVVYFTDSNFNTPASIPPAISPEIDFSWGGGSPDPAVPSNNFSASWTGRIKAGQTGTYTFYLRADDEANLFIDGTRVVSRTCCGESSGTFTMTAGTDYDINITYRELGGNAYCRLQWSGPGLSRQNVPAEHLYTDDPPPSVQQHIQKLNNVLDAWPGTRPRNP